MSDGAQSPGQPDPAPPRPAWPEPPTQPQTWQEPPTASAQQVPEQPAAWPPQQPAWPQRTEWPQQRTEWPQQEAPSRPAQPPPWPQQQPPPWPQQQAAWPPRQAGPPRPAAAPYGRGMPGQERYAIRPPPERYGQQYEPGQQTQEWAPLPLHGQEMQPMTVAPKNPAVSVLLSIFIPGLGSMVNDNVGTGVAILILNIIGWMLAIVLIGIPIAIGTWIWGLVDAHRSAQRWNRAHGIIS